MVGHDRGNNREAETGTALFARIVGLENARAQAWIDTRAVVRDFESYD